jgi:hypothetical protein
MRKSGILELILLFIIYIVGIVIIQFTIKIDIIKKLKPVIFKWDKREWYDNENVDGTRKNKKLNVGFLAQDLKKLQEDNGWEYLNLVYESNPNKLECTLGNLLTPLITSVQELSQQVDKLTLIVNEQQETINCLMENRNQ